MPAIPVARPARTPGGAIVICALVALTALSWYSLVAWPMPMPGESGVRAPAYVVLTFSMWLVMMVAMMTPTVAPTVLLFHRVERQGSGPHGGLRVASFVTGYFTAWAAFSLGATGLQVTLIEAGAIDTMGVSTSRWGTVVMLAAAAAYPWLPFRDACLQQCRSPAEFLAGHYHRGATGAWRTGVEHGALCVTCCWVLMLLLFVGGVMNLAWIGGLTLVVLVEKLAPGRRLVRIALSATLALAAIATVAGSALH